MASLSRKDAVRTTAPENVDLGVNGGTPVVRPSHQQTQHPSINGVDTTPGAYSLVSTVAAVGNRLNTNLEGDGDATLSLHQNPSAAPTGMSPADSSVPKGHKVSSQDPLTNVQAPILPVEYDPSQRRSANWQKLHDHFTVS